MSYSHSNVYIVRVVDTDENDGEPHTWFVGPYGATRADQTAAYLERVARESTELRVRQCYVEALFSDEECLRVGDYTRKTEGSLQ